MTKGGLNLTSRQGLLQGGKSGPAIKPRDSEASLLIKKITGSPPQMPKNAKPLGAEQIALLRLWIDRGATWPDAIALAPPLTGRNGDEKWWSLTTLTQPPVPSTSQDRWAKNPIDAFILAGLKARGLKPSAEADRLTLIRRLTVDLHGLLPTPDEINQFMKDKHPDAYERLVERLLASERYGQRWGRHWLDQVHYGDTHGYDKDKRRDWAWPYRDYVIRSLNSDKPYGRFVEEQLAGDVLFPLDSDAIIATGFIAAGPWDFVGHVELREDTVDKKKTRTLDRDDMVANTMSTFQSLTAHCARCHDHKFDPIPQKDYYALQAVFAGVDRGDRPYESSEIARRRSDLISRRQQMTCRLEALQKQISRLTSPALARIDNKIDARRAELARVPRGGGDQTSPSNGYHSGISDTPEQVKWVQVDLGKQFPIDEVRLVPARPTDFPDSPGFGFPARFQVAVSADPSLAKWDAIADYSQADFPNPKDNTVSLAAGKQPAQFVRVTANKLWLRANDYVFALAELQVFSQGKNVARNAVVTGLDSIEAGRWSTRFLVDGWTSRSRLPDADDAMTAIDKKRYVALEDDVRRLAKTLDQIVPTTIRGELEQVSRELARIENQIKSLPALKTVFAVVSHEPRPIYLLRRGDVEYPLGLVRAAALSCVQQLEPAFRDINLQKEGSRRAALGRWIIDPRNPLTARSIVNRVWHHHFGKGIVDTPNDLGRHGSLPSHAELLDWLACRFQNDGQSLKKLTRLIVCSATYRQSSANNPAFASLDQDNRYLWRMNRQRLDAESIRDSVLAISGNLDGTMGGPGFELFNFKDDHSPVYDHAAIDKINDPRSWRRTVYRFVVRSVPNPFLECLDCADANINTPVRNTTLTALQALAMLNDPFMIKQSELLAQKLRTQSLNLDAQIDMACQLIFGRYPDKEEKAALAGYCARHGLANACRLLFNANEFVFVD
jgi:hypothetical protein